MSDPTASPNVILVIDDETAIRQAVRDILEPLPVPAIMAATGRKTLDLHTAHRDRIKAVLPDLQMPIMDGIETYMRLRQINNAAPMIFSSGLDETMTNINFDTNPNRHFLGKPYTPDALLAIIQTTMGQ